MKKREKEIKEALAWELEDQLKDLNEQLDKGVIIKKNMNRKRRNY